MKNKSAVILPIILVTLPLFCISLYFLLKNASTPNFLLAIGGFVCVLGSIVLTIFSVLPMKRKN